MLQDLKKQLNNQEQLTADDFKIASKQLLARQFLMRERPSDRQSWRLITNHYDYFENLFDALGWQLHRDDELSLIGILPGDQESHTRLKLVETLFLLVLRLLYEEGMDRLEIQDGCAFISSHTLSERYEALFKRELPTKTLFKKILNRFKQHGVLEMKDNDDNGMPELKVFPTIRLITGPEVQQRISAHCEAFSSDQETDQDDTNINGENHL